MSTYPDCSDGDTYAFVASVGRRAPRRSYTFWAEMLSALVIGWWLIWQAVIP
jgi:hypothetical protein